MLLSSITAPANTGLCSLHSQSLIKEENCFIETNFSRDAKACMGLDECMNYDEIIKFMCSFKRTHVTSASRCMKFDETIEYTLSIEYMPSMGHTRSGIAIRNLLSRLRDMHSA